MIDSPRSCLLSLQKKCYLCMSISVAVITGFVITVLKHPQQCQSLHSQQQPQMSQQSSKARNKTCKYFNSSDHTCLCKQLDDGSACTDKGG